MSLRSITCFAAFVTLLCLGAPRALAQPAYAGAYVGRSFPEASEKITLTVGETRDGYFEFTNAGTATWSTTTTKLATIPRDAESPLHDASWENEARCTTVEAETPPGEVGRFSFTIRGNEPGDYLYAFGLVEEGVTWFADDGGPPDDSVFLRVRVIAPPPPTTTAVASTSASAATAAGSGSGGDGGSGGALGGVNGTDGGCDCKVGRGSSGGRIIHGIFVLLAGLTVLWARSCKRRR